MSQVSESSIRVKCMSKVHALRGRETDVALSAETYESYGCALNETPTCHNRQHGQVGVYVVSQRLGRPARGI